MSKSRVAALALLLALPGLGQARSAKYNGTWWLAQPREVQIEFVRAYGDCYVDTLGAPSPPPVDEYRLAEEITKYYRSGGSRSRLVASVMKLVWRRYKGYREPARPEEGEVWPEKHGFFDGLYWRQGKPAERVGFVEGLVACFNSEARSNKKFSQEPSAYVRYLDDWYEKAYQQARCKANKVDLRATKIMDVFLQFADAKKPPLRKSENTRSRTPP